MYELRQLILHENDDASRQAGLPPVTVLRQVVGSVSGREAALELASRHALQLSERARRESAQLPEMVEYEVARHLRGLRGPLPVQGRIRVDLARGAAVWLSAESLHALQPQETP